MTLDVRELERAVVAGVEVSRVLGETIEGEPERLVVNVVPILADGYLVKRDSKHSYELELSLTKSRAPETAKQAPAGSGVLGSIEIPLRVQGRSSGCSQVALSIWDEYFTAALDSLVVSVPIGPPIDGYNNCFQKDGEPPAILGGAPIVADLMPAISGAKPDRSLAMHVFEMAAGNLPERTYAVFASQSDEESWIGGWQMESLLSEVLGENGDLARMIKTARNNLDDDNLRDRAYADVAVRLTEKIFSARDADPDQQATANKAKAQLIAKVKDSSTPTTLVARFSQPGADGADLYYVPLRLMAAPNAGIVEKDFRVVQPLPKRTVRSDSCIAHWTVFAPHESKEDALDSEAQSALERIAELGAKSWRDPTKSSFKELDGFFRDTSSREKRRGEGLVLLAHHSAARGFWFGEKDAGVAVEAMTRQFPPDSVAMLGVCSVAGPQSADKIIRRLNLQNVRSMIVSPFAVQSSYAIRFGEKFVEVLDAAYEGNTTPTMQELFDLAVEKTAKSYADGSRPGMRQMGMEFLLAGAPELRLCKMREEE